jgi:hypothetical protein
MAMLKNPRRELFAQLLASGKTATDAYELAGYKRAPTATGGSGKRSFAFGPEQENQQPVRRPPQV